MCPGQKGSPGMLFVTYYVYSLGNLQQPIKICINSLWSFAFLCFSFFSIDLIKKSKNHPKDNLPSHSCETTAKQDGSKARKTSAPDPSRTRSHPIPTKRKLIHPGIAPYGRLYERPRGPLYGPLCGPLGACMDPYGVSEWRRICLISEWAN